MRNTLQHGAMLLAIGALTVSGALAQTENPNAGRDLAAACSNCHGTNGVSRSEVPSIAGRAAFVTTAIMREFRDGKRVATIMHQIAKGYTDEQIGLISAYFATQKAK